MGPRPGGVMKTQPPRGAERRQQRGSLGRWVGAPPLPAQRPVSLHPIDFTASRPQAGREPQGPGQHLSLCRLQAGATWVGHRVPSGAPGTVSSTIRTGHAGPGAHRADGGSGRPGSAAPLEGPLLRKQVSRLLRTGGGHRSPAAEQWAGGCSGDPGPACDLMGSQHSVALPVTPSRLLQQGGPWTDTEDAPRAPPWLLTSQAL